MRHGKAQEHGDAWDDFERTLVDRGRKEVRNTAELIQKSGLIPDLLVSSPAARTAGTARIVADVFGYPHDHILYHAPLYNSISEDYIDLINNLKANCILIVGHNPEMQSLSFHFGKLGRDGFPTSSAAALKFEDAVISGQSKAEILGEWLRK